jgi:hypothetical protein
MLWWYWVVGGVALMLLELAGPTFYILWFGIAAVLVGVLCSAVSISLTAQIVIWTLLSLVLAVLWFKYVPAPRKTTAGQSKDALVGERGMIVREVSEMQKGTIRFQKPILGSDSWTVIADERIASGERAQIVDVIGQTLKVEKLKPSGG